MRKRAEKLGGTDKEEVIMVNSLENFFFFLPLVFSTYSVLTSKKRTLIHSFEHIMMSERRKNKKVFFKKVERQASDDIHNQSNELLSFPLCTGIPTSY